MLFSVLFSKYETLKKNHLYPSPFRNRLMKNSRNLMSNKLKKDKKISKVAAAKWIIKFYYFQQSYLIFFPATKHYTRKTCFNHANFPNHISIFHEIRVLIYPDLETEYAFSLSFSNGTHL